MDLGGFALVTLAAARVTRLVTSDEITRPLRAKAGRGWFRYMLGCPWCAGLWIALATSLGWWLVGHHPIAQMVAVGLAANLVWGIASEVLGSLSDATANRILALRRKQGGPR